MSETIDASAVEKEPPAPETPPAPPVPALVTEAAFVVYLDQQGHWVADDSLNRPIQVARNANFIDFHNACSTILKDVVVQETAQRVVQIQQQVATQMAEEMRTRQIAQQIGGPVGAGLHIPGQ